jgi:hypothetical protein
MDKRVRYWIKEMGGKVSQQEEHYDEDKITLKRFIISVRLLMKCALILNI